MERYEKLKGLIGEGAHGVVHKALVLEKTSGPNWWPLNSPQRNKIKSSGKRKHAEGAAEYVAIKKIRVKDSKLGLSMDAIREIKLLQELRHPNVMKVMDIFNHDSNINIVMQFMEMDLEKIIKAVRVPLTPGDVKQYMSMILEAVEYLHSNWVLHRDIKPGNLLVDKNGQLQLADFGLAKIYGSPDRDLSHQACTLWYRAPEMLFGAKSYGTGADMWSVGCVFAELLSRKPFFPGDGEINQLQTILAVLGTPTEEDWPGLTSLPQYTKFAHTPGAPLKLMFGAATSDALDLLAGLMTYDPRKRLTASQAKNHAYFRSQPPPTPIGRLPTSADI